MTFTLLQEALGHFFLINLPIGPTLITETWEGLLFPCPKQLNIHKDRSVCHDYLYVQKYFMKTSLVQ